jgi:hypothetical protein
MINAVGPICIGMVVGWMLYFFMRMYRLFSPKTLAATLTAIAGGPVLTFLEKLTGGNNASPNIGLYYFLGVAIGFFAYAIYAGILSMMFAFGKIKNRPKFEVAIGCGAGSSEGFDLLERLMDFEELVKDWHDGKYTDDELKKALPSLEFTRRDYFQVKRDGDFEFELDATCLEKFEKGGYVHLLKIN